MKTFDRIFLAVARLFTFIYLRGGIYRFWSKLYQAIWERKRVSLTWYDSFSHFVGVIRTLKWRPDSWRQLWDAFSNPYHIQHIISNDKSLAIGDCDDFAIYEVEVLSTQSIGIAKPWEINNAEVLTVMWMYENPAKGEQKTSGHNVCLLTHLDGSYSYMDYGYPGKRFGTISQVVAEVLKNYASQSVLISWGRSNRSLKCLEYSTS